MSSIVRQDGGARRLGVVITGGSTGLGRAMALEFLRAGDRVVICGRNPSRLASAARFLRRALPHGELHEIACDVSNRDDVSRLVAFAVSSIGVIDRWINNAGSAGISRKPVWELDPGDIDETCRTNLSGSMMLCSEAIRAMRRQPDPGTGPLYHIFNMGFSEAGARSSRTAVHHRVSKLAVARLSALVAMELKLGGIGSIGIHELSPGLVLTGLLLRDAGPSERRFFNAVAETPETVAAILVPKIRSARGSGGVIRFRPVPVMLLRIAASLFGFGRDRFFGPDGRRLT